jgi:hypothetical protein
MAKLKATPRNYEQAAEYLAGRSSVKLGNNTYLKTNNPMCLPEGYLPIVVRLHKTDIVKFFPDDRVTLHTGGYRTVTTKERINQFIAGRVYQKNHSWFYQPAGDIATRPIAREFTEGIEVS